MIFGSTALEVGIGMIFVYLLPEPLCSAVAEYLEAKMNYRSKDLEKGIRFLLDQYVPEETPTGKVGEEVNSLAAELYKHPLVKSLYRGDKLPSLIPYAPSRSRSGTWPSPPISAPPRSQRRT